MASPFKHHQPRSSLPRDSYNRDQVIVWEMGEMRTVRVLEGYHRRAVTTVKFSSDGRLLATMGADDHHGLAVYDWENSVLLCTTRCTSRVPSQAITMVDADSKNRMLYGSHNYIIPVITTFAVTVSCRAMRDEQPRKCPPHRHIGTWGSNGRLVI